MNIVLDLFFIDAATGQGVAGCVCIGYGPLVPPQYNTRFTQGDGGCNFYSGPQLVSDQPFSYALIPAAGYMPSCSTDQPIMFGTSNQRITVPLKRVSFRQPLESLAKIRGAMWTQRLNLPMGPYPGQDYNINAMDFYEFYTPDDRKRMIEKTLRDGFTHAVTGPIFDPDGYHGNWPTHTDLSQSYWDSYLDRMQEWKDAGIVPVHFMKPDNWTLDGLRQSMEHLYTQDRAKALLPILVPPGWEPTRYGWSSRTWGTFFDWAAAICPDALILGHTVCDVDAMKGRDAAYDDEPETNDLAWQYLAPKLHGWLIQLCGYVFMNPYTPQGIHQWESNLAGYFQDADLRFRHGKAGWPTGSKWGADIPLKLYYGEGASYRFFNDPAVSESLAWSFGDIAMANGANGYLDGGTVGV